jgi:hypothetical protein
MKILNVKPVKVEDVEIRVVNTTVLIIGRLTHSEPDMFLWPFIQSMHKAILKNQIKNISIDLRQLSFINSASLAEFVRWINLLETVGDEERYTIQFICNANQRWQEASISSLVYLNPQCVSKVMG